MVEPKSTSRNPALDGASKGRPPAKVKAEDLEGGAEASRRWWRELIESFVIAIVLAVMFRAFEAEAFVIPTGSMAKTLQGKHFDVWCEKCNYRYQVGDSERVNNHHAAGVCPMCRFPMRFHQGNPMQAAFTGDRILVNKFLYEFTEPRRWDVIVFKFPMNAKQNYIKRLVGLPNETIRVRHGNIFVRDDLAAEGAAFADPHDDGFRIARRHPAKLRSMLQLVHDTHYEAADLTAAGLPPFWREVAADGGATAEGAGAWSRTDAPAGPVFRHEGGAAAGEPTWLRYGHLVPSLQQWNDLRLNPSTRFDDQRPQLITDFYAYNTRTDSGHFLSPIQLGVHWVGELAVEADVKIEGGEGTLSFDLVKAGVHYTCHIDVATGTATLTINGAFDRFVQEPASFAEASRRLTASPTASTRVRGPGRYQITFANCDHELVLWVDGAPISFDLPTTFSPPPPEENRPHWSLTDPGDLLPAGVAARGVAVEVERLRVLRDIYYIATRGGGQADLDAQRGLRDHDTTDYRWNSPDGVRGSVSIDQVAGIMADWRAWATTPLWEARRTIEITLGPDQFLPMGDNSPQSSDGRMWQELVGRGHAAHGPLHPYVERHMLIGKAFLVYWPHPWPVEGTPIFRRWNFQPNVEDMRWVR